MTSASSRSAAGSSSEAVQRGASSDERLLAAAPVTLVIALLAAAVAAGGCSAKRFEYDDKAEIPEGSGIFSGEEGAFQIGEANVTASQEASRQSVDCACPDREEFEEFEAYREFLRWKAQAFGTRAYREFQDWRVWRRQKGESP